MAHPYPDDSNRYLTDIVNLSASLDEVIARGDQGRLLRALSQGKERYFDLVFRRLSLEFRPGDAAIVLWMLDFIQIRLADLARLQLERSVPAGARDGWEASAAGLDG
jgi:hypothetical protein